MIVDGPDGSRSRAQPWVPVASSSAPPTNSAAALGHHRGRAADRVGQVEIRDRRARTPRRSSSPACAERRPRPPAAITVDRRPAAAASSAMRARTWPSVSSGTLRSEHLGQRPQDLPILLGLARREHRELAALQPALGVDPAGVLLGVGGTRQDHVGRGWRRGRRGGPGRPRTPRRARLVSSSSAPIRNTTSISPDSAPSQDAGDVAPALARAPGRGRGRRPGRPPCAAR